MVNGGYPEVVMNPSIGKNYLSTLFDSVLLKDIVRRYQISHIQQLYDLSNYLLLNYTIPYSYNQLKDDLNLNSVLTVQKFMGYLSESCLVRSLTGLDKAFKKIYLVDNGFLQSCTFELSTNCERLLENMVFVELLRRGFQPELDLFYYKTRNNQEVDFVCRKGHHTEQLIQVYYDVSYDVSGSKMLKRKTEALVTSSLLLCCNDLIVITWTMEEVMW